ESGYTVDKSKGEAYILNAVFLGLPWPLLDLSQSIPPETHSDIWALVISAGISLSNQCQCGNKHATFEDDLVARLTGSKDMASRHWNAATSAKLIGTNCLHNLAVILVGRTLTTLYGLVFLAGRKFYIGESWIWPSDAWFAYVILGNLKIKT